jgi:hypothetical protein
MVDGDSARDSFRCLRGIVAIPREIDYIEFAFGAFAGSRHLQKIAMETRPGRGCAVENHALNLM